MPKFKKWSENAAEEELGNSKSITKCMMPETGFPDDIDGETKQNVHLYSKNMAVAIEGNLQTDEDLKKRRNNELTPIISEGVKKTEDSVADTTTSKNAFPRQSHNSSASSSSQTPFMIFKSKSFKPEFSFDNLNEECSESLMEWDVADNVIVEECVEGKPSVETTKHFYHNNDAKKDSHENSVEEQDRFLPSSLGENEIKELREALEKYLLNYLKKLSSEALKRDNLHQKKDNWSPISERNTSKCKYNEKDVNTRTSTSPSSDKFRNNSVVNVKPRTLPEVYLTCAQSSRSIQMKPSSITEQRCSCDSGDANCLPSKSTTIHWGLDTYEVQEKRNLPGQVNKTNAAKNHPFNNCLTLSGKSNKIKKNEKEEYFGKGNNKSNLKKIHKTGGIENLDIYQTNESDEEYDRKQNNNSKWKKTHKIDKSNEKLCCKRNKVFKWKATNKMDGTEALYVRHPEECDESDEHIDESDKKYRHKRNKKSNSKKVHEKGESDEEYSCRRKKKLKWKNFYKTGKMKYHRISCPDESDEKYDNRKKSMNVLKTGEIENFGNRSIGELEGLRVNEDSLIYLAAWVSFFVSLGLTLLSLICFLFVYYFFLR